MPDKLKILLIGNGNVATQLAVLFSSKNFDVSVFGRDFNKTLEIAKKTTIRTLESKSQIIDEYHLVFFCVKDSVIAKLVIEYGKISPNAIFVHCSGSVSINIFNECVGNYGVFYPLQTFGKEIEKNWKSLPLLIEGNNNLSEETLEKIASSISEKVEIIRSKERLRIHISAVIVNNFVNHLYFKAFNLLQKNGLEKEMLYPLIQKTVENALTKNPAEIQTGPAKRNDDITLNMHYDLLSNEDAFLNNIYKTITLSIIDTYKK
jgi:predicted short-subunit dehydrogenase-like oxidoreductase (DUF2520 family)